MRCRYLIFDLDGTLVESLPGIAEGLNRSLTRMGKAGHTHEAVHGMIGQGAKNLCAQALGYTRSQDCPEAELRELLRNFSEEYPHCWQGEGTLAYVGIDSMLAQLAAKGVRMAVLSNKPHEVTLPIVRELFASYPLEPVLGYQEGVMPRKPHPAAIQFIAESWGITSKQLMLVGDSIHDAETAEAASCQLCLVNWGYSQAGVLNTYAAERGVKLCESVSELQNYLMH